MFSKKKCLGVPTEVPPGYFFQKLFQGFLSINPFRHFLRYYSSNVPCDVFMDCFIKFQGGYLQKFFSKIFPGFFATISAAIPSEVSPGVPQNIPGISSEYPPGITSEIVGFVAMRLADQKHLTR